MQTRPVFQVAVIMRREQLDNRWQPWRWVLEDVVPQEPAFGTAPRLLRQTDEVAQWLFPGFSVELFRDDAEGYHLNATSPAPCWFVLWRLDEEPAEGADSAQRLARPVEVSLSYHDAGRWLDAQETAEQVPVPPEVLAALQAFVAEHYQPEPKRRKRPDSFQPLQDRFGNPASVSTEKHRGGGGRADGFLGRWSRRKQEVREGKPLQEPEPPHPAPPVQAAHAVGVPPAAVTPQAAQPAAAIPEPAPLPTLQEAQALSIDSDFKPFVGRAVAPEVRNTAMKKLFTDPHFNVMDGLDIYIEDYTQPDPLPAAMLRQMASAQFMGLVDPEPESPQMAVQQPLPEAADALKDPASAPQTEGDLAESAQDVAQSGVCTAIPSPLGAVPVGSEPEPGVPAPASHPEHDHAHLRLQPDDAVERPGPGRSAS